MLLSDRLAPTWDVGTFVDVARSDFRNPDLRTEDKRYGLSVDKTWSRHWSTALDYVHYRRDMDGPSGDSRQNIWLLTVTYRHRCGRFGAPKPPEPLGRASCRARVCQYAWISVGAEQLKKK